MLKRWSKPGNFRRVKKPARGTGIGAKTAGTLLMLMLAALLASCQRNVPDDNAVSGGAAPTAARAEAPAGTAAADAGSSAGEPGDTDGVGGGAAGGSAAPAPLVTPADPAAAPPEKAAVAATPERNGGASEPQPTIRELSGFTPHPVKNGNKSVYTLDLRMDQEGEFTVKAEIDVVNLSGETWDQLVFYMIPNVFTQRTSPDLFREDAAFKLGEVKLDGVKAAPKLEGDTLTVPLKPGLAPSAHAKVTVNYSFRVPEQGIRFSRTGHSYDLAQWYPMLATYVNGVWNKQPYQSLTESHHTDFSDFTLRYKLPEPYYVISSSDDDPAQPSSAGELRAKQVRELMVSFTQDLTPTREIEEGAEIVVWAGAEAERHRDSAEKTAAEAMRQFSRQIGPYAHKQLDVILGDRHSMEYPGVVTVSALDDSPPDRVVVHEIAHQWFYGMVASDPYHAAWLDEGLTEMATALFYGDYSFAERFYKPNLQFSDLPLSGYGNGELTSSVYVQPVIKFKALWEDRQEDGMSFLRTYFHTYRHKQVDTKEFMAFVRAYYGMKDNAFFAGWIKEQ